MDQIDRLIGDYLSQLSAEGYTPQYEFATAEQEGGSGQLYALPTTEAQRAQFGQGSYFASDPDRPLTSQGLNTGQYPDAVALTEEQARTDPQYAKDYEVWQRHLGKFAAAARPV